MILNKVNTCLMVLKGVYNGVKFEVPEVVSAIESPHNYMTKPIFFSERIVQIEPGVYANVKMVIEILKEEEL